jgi:hypothetical protein
MFVRPAIVAAVLLVSSTAQAEPLDADTAHRFVVGKTFAYNCFDGTRGAGQIQSDLSVAGTIQIKGSGPVRFVMLPPGTLRVKGQNVCASVRGIPFEPCFNVDKTTTNSFRGSVQGFNFAFCDFTHRVPRRPTLRSTVTSRQQPAEPLQIQTAATAPR